MSSPILSSVQNGLKIIQLFTLEKPIWGITEISNTLQLHKTTVSRLVADLVAEGYLEKNQSKYQLGLSLLCLSGVITSHLEIFREAKETLHTLVNKLDETVHIAVLEEANIIYLHKVECKNPLRLLSYIGKKNPANCTSSGKVILAYQPQNVVQRVIESGLPKMGPNSITDKGKFMEDLHQVKLDGFSICIDEMHEDAVSIAAPVRDYTEQVIAAISVVGSKQRIPENKHLYFAKEVKKAANEISTKLGFFQYQ